MTIERHEELVRLVASLPDPAVPSDFINRALRRPLESLSHRLRYSVFSLPIGRLFIGFDEAIVLSQVEGDSVAFEDLVRQELGRRPERVEAPAALQAAVQATVEGERRFHYPVDLRRLGSFQQRVLATTREIPWGQVRSYAAIARSVGSPKAARAVGSALARNPMPVVIPCHRVVRSDARIGEYSGGGPAIKARILGWEGIPIETRRGGFRVAVEKN